MSSGSTPTVKNTIIANSSPAGDCAEGRVISLGHNLDSDGTCGLTEPTDLPNTDPLLGPLADNGGPTLTHALLPTSPAIDAGSCMAVDGSPVTTDQRDATRPQGAACDIGAYEVQPPLTLELAVFPSDSSGTHIETTSQSPFVDIAFNQVVTLTRLDLHKPDGTSDDILRSAATTDNVHFIVTIRNALLGEYRLTADATTIDGATDSFSRTFRVVQRRANLGLSPGWNLVSFPSTPRDYYIDSVFGSPSVDAVVSFDPFQGGAIQGADPVPCLPFAAIPTAPGCPVAIRDTNGQLSGNLTYIRAGLGYWVRSTSFETLRVGLGGLEAGSLALPPSFHLPVGWSLVGVATTGKGPGTTIPADQYFSDLSWTRAYRYEATTQRLVLLEPGTGAEVEVGKGYYVDLSISGVLLATPTPPSGVGLGATVADSQALVPITPGWNYVSLPGAPADTGINAVIPPNVPIDLVITRDPTKPGGWGFAERGDDGLFPVGTSFAIATIDEGRAYWMRSTMPFDLAVELHPSPSAPAYDIFAGWNAVGITAVQSHSLQDLDSDGQAAEYDMDAYLSSVDWLQAIAYDPRTGSWEGYNRDSPVAPKQAKIGKGYWVYARSAGRLLPFGELPPPTLSIADLTVSEGAGTATLTISLDAATTSAVTVDYATADGTATAPGDYTATSGTATIPAGQTSATIAVPIIDDSLDEPDETFTVTLSNQTAGAVVSPTAGTATVTIVDNDAPPFEPTPTPSPTATVVNTTDDLDDGTCDASHCSMREALNATNGNLGTDTIAFNIPGAGPHTIRPDSALPSITDAVVIDGYTQPGASPNTNPITQGSNAVLKIELDGTNAGNDAMGLAINAGGCVVRGLAINRFKGHGMRLDTNSGTVIEGNYIGTDVIGTADLGNTWVGVEIVRGANNTIGGHTAAARNIISGNGIYGVHISESSGNVVQGNFIGTDITGTADLGNDVSGVRINALSNTIGGATEGARNIVSGNAWAGIHIVGLESSGNLVHGNFIGTDVTGTLDLGNDAAGVLLEAPGNSVGGPTEGARNIISGNGWVGVDIVGVSSTVNVVQGNFIGTDVTGTADLGNGSSGVRLEAPGNTVGGITPEARNIISGNGWAGFSIEDPSATDNVVQGNFIGTDVTGMLAMANDWAGGQVVNGASTNMIGGALGTTPGGPCTGACNLISANLSDGIRLEGKGVTGNVVLGNYIGTNARGTAPLGNAFAGVVVWFGASGNTIGGTSAETRNVISGNDTNGFWIAGAETTGNLVQGNYVGTDATGAAALGNIHIGVVIIDGAFGNTIGGTTPGARNIISGNGSHGILISGPATSGNAVQGGFIGSDETRTPAMGNSADGVPLTEGYDDTVWGIAAGGGNLASVNAGNGINLLSTAGNLVAGNLIGTQADAASPRGNGRHGIEISGTNDNTVGGTSPEAANTIAFNGMDGVFVSSGTGNAVLSNSIFSNAGLGIDLGGDGVTGNDAADADLGPNKLQNFPVIAAVEINGAGDLLVEYSVDSTVDNAAYPLRVEFYKADADGEEGQVFLGYDTYAAADTQVVRTANLGNAAALGVAAADPIVATATDADGNTSEFEPPPTFEVSAPSVVGEADGSFTVVVSLANPGTAPSTVQLSTEDDIALAGQEYVAVSQTLTLSATQPTASVVVSLLDDAVLERAERLFVKLHAASPGLDIAGADAGGVLRVPVVIDDSEDAPPGAGIITTVAGGSVRDGGPATDASLFFPRDAAVDSQGNLFIADQGHHRIRRG